MTHRVGPKGQVVIPKDIRKQLGIVPGDEVQFSVDEEAVRVEPARQHPSLRGSLAGFRLVELLEAEHRAEKKR